MGRNSSSFLYPRWIGGNLSGTAESGSVATYYNGYTSTDYTITYTPATGSYTTGATYQWYTGTSSATGTAISGATSSTYTFNKASVGTYNFVCKTTIAGSTYEKSVQYRITQRTYDVVLTIADLITLAENENCTKVIVGLTDSTNGADIAAAMINKGSTYTLRNRIKSSIESNDSLSTFGITTELYDFTNDSNRVILSSKEFIMITNDCTVLPSDNWFKSAFKPWEDLPKVRTMYVNKNLTGNYSISGVVNLTRLILGNDITQITGKGAISNTNSLPELSIPSGVTQLGDKSIRVNDGPSDMHIYCSLSSADVAKLLIGLSQTVHTTGPKPISQQ